jgi:hypothetical protein
MDFPLALPLNLAAIAMGFVLFAYRGQIDDWRNRIDPRGWTRLPLYCLLAIICVLLTGSLFATILFCYGHATDVSILCAVAAFLAYSYTGVRGFNTHRINSNENSWRSDGPPLLASLLGFAATAMMALSATN